MRRKWGKRVQRGSIVMTKDVLQKDLLDYKAYFLINLSILVANYDYWSNVVVPIKKGLRV